VWGAAAPDPAGEICIRRLERVPHGSGSHRPSRSRSGRRTAPRTARPCRAARHDCGSRGPRPPPATLPRAHPGQPRRERTAGLAAALRAAHPHAPMLDHLDRESRQFLDLVARRRACRNTLTLVEDVPTPEHPRPVADTHRPPRPAAVLGHETLVPGLTALRTTRPLRGTGGLRHASTARPP
jgi:hypothetical protein